MLSAQSSTPISAALDASSVALPARAMSGDEADRRRWTPPLLRGGSAGLAEEEEEHEASAALPARTVTCGARSMVCWKEKENAGTSMERFFFRAEKFFAWLSRRESESASMKTRLGVTVSLLSLSQNSFFPRTSTREEATTLAKVRTSFVSSSLLSISLSLERQARFKIERERERKKRGERKEAIMIRRRLSFFSIDGLKSRLRAAALHVSDSRPSCGPRRSLTVSFTRPRGHNGEKA